MNEIPQQAMAGGGGEEETLQQGPTAALWMQPTATTAKGEAQRRHTPVNEIPQLLAASSCHRLETLQQRPTAAVWYVLGQCPQREAHHKGKWEKN